MKRLRRWMIAAYLLLPATCFLVYRLSDGAPIEF